MASDLTFTPPRPPPMMLGDELSKFIVGIYPELSGQDNTHLRDLVAAMDAYQFTCREYQARNAHFAEWMTWYKENPTQKDKLVAFATEHNVCFASARSALQMLDKAIGRLIEEWGDRQNLSSIRAVFATVDKDAQKLAENLKALQSLSDPAGQPQILPQKRPVSSP